MMGYRFCVFSVEEKKEIIQLLKKFLIKTNNFSDEKKSIESKNMNMVALLDQTNSKVFGLFLEKHIPAYVSVFFLN